MRLFVGIPLPGDVREALAGLRSGLPGARWAEPRDMHVTLRFIGEVGKPEAEHIDAALGAVRAPAFELAFSGIGLFQSGSRVRTVWARLERSTLLVHLREKVESAVVRAGLEPERRKFKPHVTLARLKNTPGGRVGAYVEAQDAFAVGPFPVTGFALIRSFLNRDGPHYEPVAEYALHQPFFPEDTSASAAPATALPARPDRA